MGERIDQVDADDRVVGTTDRATAVRRGLLHRVAGVICRDTRGRYLIHQRPAGAPWFGGMYAPVLGGAVLAGETYQDAAARELREELGLTVPVRFCLKFLCQGAIGQYWFALHHARLAAGQPLVPDPAEIANVAWLTGDQLREATARLPFIPEVHDAFDRYRHHDQLSDGG